MKTLAKALAIVLVLAVLATGASAQGSKPAVVSVDNYTVRVGQEFTVPVRIAGVSNLYGADVRLTYNPATLTGVLVDHGYFLQPDFVVRKGFYGNPPNYARYALTQVNPTLPANGSGTLMYVTFRAVASGVSPLALRVELANRNGVPIPATVQSGAVTVVASNEK